jgi:hypothetical protein
VADSAGQTATVNRSIVIAKHLALTALCGGPACGVELGCLTVCGRFGTQTGGVAPFKYTLNKGPLPPGMGLSALSLTGSFPAPQRSALGAPLPYVLTVAVADSMGATSSVTAAFNVYPHIAWSNTTTFCTATTAPHACTTQLTYTGGVPNPDPKVAVVSVNAPNYNNVLVNGFSAVAKSGTVTATVSSPPNAANWSGVVTIELIDPSLCAPSTNCPASGNASITVRV